MNSICSARVEKQSFNRESSTFVTTFVVEFPRIILPEVLTHRLFSRNTSSSRAIPVKKMLERLETRKFVPEYWGKNIKGMSAKSEVSTVQKEHSVDTWYSAYRDAIKNCKNLLDNEVHKQTANRLTEPFQMVQMVITTTCLAQFFRLRDSPDAQPEIQQLARVMHRAYYTSEFDELLPGEWHLPFVGQAEKHQLTTIESIKLSVARCARVSYFLHDGKKSTIEQDLKLAERLIEAGHLSPTEHQAMCFPQNAMIGNFIGWLQYRKTLRNESSDPVKHVTMLNPYQACDRVKKHLVNLY